MNRAFLIDAQNKSRMKIPISKKLGVTGHDGSLTSTSGYFREVVGNGGMKRMLDRV